MTRSLEDYLESIWMLFLNGERARVRDIAENLGVTRPSVVNGIRQLTELGYVIHRPYASVELTVEGRKKAIQILSRHELLFTFLRSLGISDAIAEADACKMEHILSDETLAAIKTYIRKKRLRGVPDRELRAQKR